MAIAEVSSSAAVDLLGAAKRNGAPPPTPAHTTDTGATARQHENVGRRVVTVDGNEAAASVAYRLNEVIAIYPITPSSPMGEWADAWAAAGQPNIWGTVPRVIEMQSEGGAAGAVHGALQAGSMATTFTASQGLLLMIPNMYKIAGELTPAVFHVAARTLATHALSIFGDHSDVMAARQTGWAMLASNTVQEAHDFALIAQAATLEARVPFLHFFDGFRTSHEVMKIEQLADDDLRVMIDEALVRAHRAAGLNPERPVLRGSAQNPDVFFQAREAANPYYLAAPDIVQRAMDRFARLTGRQYHLFDYVGHPLATRVIVVMGSGAETVAETVKVLNETRGARLGVLKVRLFRPFGVQDFIRALPETVDTIAVLDRTKEPGATGEPLYQDVVTALNEAATDGTSPFFTFPRIVGGRYGLASKEFTPAMARAIFDELDQIRPKNHFTVGIVDDVTNTSLDYDPSFSIEQPDTVRALFYGLGSDGTVGANKNSIKIIGEETPNYAQGYFSYDSKKSGTVTVSHLRFGPEPIHAPYLITDASFVACHQFHFLEQMDVLQHAANGATFLLNSPYGPDEVWEHLPRLAQERILDKQLRFYVVDGYKVARETGMSRRVNTVMQACFFALSGVLPKDEAIAAIKQAIKKSYGKRGERVVQQNFQAVDSALGNLFEVRVPDAITSQIRLRPPVPLEAPEFVQEVTAMMLAGEGNDLPVSAMPAGGTFPTATSQWEKRNLALEIPVWDPELCIQCGKCVMVCPHAVIREKVYPEAELAGAPETFKSTGAKWREFAGQRYSLQVAPEDCTGCALCFEACPALSKTDPGKKAINMAPQAPLRVAEAENWQFFFELPEVDRSKLNLSLVKDSQLAQPLFEFSGACAGCGETPYLKLLTQLFGDRLIVANATGCSSIYGGNLPTTPWSQTREGRGPAWANSLFEDNAEFGLGIRVSVDKQVEYARSLVRQVAGEIGAEFAAQLLEADQTSEKGIQAQRSRVHDLKARLLLLDTPEARELLSVADSLIKRSLWMVGGDGWAYDIGYGGLDHVLASGQNVNILVMDTEVYSNTGGQQSKATPRGAAAKFATAGKAVGKKDLGLLAMTYGNVYVARIAFGANDAHTIKVLQEAEAYDGPALVIAYAHCIEHGYDMRFGLDQQKKAVASAYWPLFRYNPRLADQGKNPFALDSKAPTLPLADYVYNEDRYRALKQRQPEAAAHLLSLAREDVASRWKLYEELASGLSLHPAVPAEQATSGTNGTNGIDNGAAH